jgi:hypothetical protein
MNARAFSGGCHGSRVARGDGFDHRRQSGSRLGTFPFSHDVDGTATNGKLSATHPYHQAGTRLATARVTSHHSGNAAAISRRITNLASARIVVVNLAAVRTSES